ncbi:MAG: hypothetical protein GX770_05130 [Firmicutes bacterium]|nr:hypothetical protein [Bacillota bacterium]
MTHQKIVVLAYCLVLILFCTLFVPWQGVFHFQRSVSDFNNNGMVYDHQAKIFLGYAPVFRDPGFDYDEQMIEYIGKRIGIPSMDSRHLNRTSISYNIDLSRLVVEIFVLTVFAAMIYVIISKNERDDYKNE